MRTLAAAVSVEHGKPITAPGYFVSVAFAATYRASTRGTITWDSQTWLGASCSVSGLALDGGPAQDGALTFGDTDGVIAALALDEGVADRAVEVWAFHGSAPAAGDPVRIFSGVADGYRIDTERAIVTIGLKQAQVLFAPRLYISQASGFNWLPAAGTKLVWNGETYELKRGAN